MIAARAVNVPWDDQDPDVVIAQIAADPTRSDIGALLVFFSAALVIPAVLTLIGLARTRMPRTALVGGTLAGLGCVAVAAVGSLSLAGGQVVRLLPEATAAQVWLPVVSHDQINLWHDLGGLGFVVLAVALFRSGLVPKIAAILIGIGGLATLITTGGPIRWLLMLAAAILLTGTVWIAVAARTSAPHPTHMAAATN